MLQLLHSPSGGFENSVCLYEYLQRQHPDVRRVAMGMMEGETLEQLRGCYRWSWDHTCGGMTNTIFLFQPSPVSDEKIPAPPRSGERG